MVLQVHTHEQFPQDWAETQGNLGNTLLDQAGQSQGADAAAFLAEAVTAYRAAFEVYTREQYPQDWARRTSEPTTKPLTFYECMAAIKLRQGLQVAYILTIHQSGIPTTSV